MVCELVKKDFSELSGVKIYYSHLQYLQKIFSGLDDLYQTFVLDSTSSFSSLK